MKPVRPPNSLPKKGLGAESLFLPCRGDTPRRRTSPTVMSNSVNPAPGCVQPLNLSGGQGPTPVVYIEFSMVVNTNRVSVVRYAMPPCRLRQLSGTQAGTEPGVR